MSDLLTALADLGVRAAALVHDHRASLTGRTPADTNQNPLVYRAPCLGRWLYAPISPPFPWWLGRVIGEFKPAVLHLHMPNTSAFWALGVPAARRIPWVIHWHSDVVSSQWDRRLALAYPAYRPLEQRLLAASRAIVVTSPAYLYSSRALERWQPRCHVIPLGIDPGRVREPAVDTLRRTEKLWGRAAFKLLAIGRLTYYKGFEVLVQAVADLPDLRLLIVGQGERRPQLDRLLKTLGLEGSVTLAGALPDAELNALWTTCDAFCLPSLERTEAFGLVLLEAMRFHKPVIASDIPGSGVGWVVRQGRHGLLVKPNNPAALRDAIVRLMRMTPRQRLQLGQAGAEALRGSFDIKQVAARTLGLYQQLEGLAHGTG